GHEHERDMQILFWFSNGYYNVLRNEQGQLQLNDLRYGAFGNKADKPSDFVFKFILKEKDGQLVPRQTRDVDRTNDGTFQELWERIKGI
ncbi:MAG: metal-dependent hydrolase, partial [Bacteroidota bacterium]